MTRLQNQAYVVVSVTYRGETRDLGIFNTWEGGNITSDDTKSRRGGTRTQRALGGVASTENVTVTRDYDLARDHPNRKWLRAAVGSGDVNMAKFMTDDFDRPYGDPDNYTGRMVDFTTPDYDVNSSDEAVLSLEVSCNYPPT